MSTPSRFTKIKIAAGYLLLLLVLLVALWFIRREIETLSALETQQVLQADSLYALLREKDENILDILRSLNEVNDRLLSMDDLQEIIHARDTIVTQQRVQRTVVVKTDSLVAPVPRKGFFRRLGEVFVPSKDTAMVVNTTQSLITDTLLEEVNPADSLREKILAATMHKRETTRAALQQNTQRIRQTNQELTTRIDTLLKSYEEELIMQARMEANMQQLVRRRSTRTIGGIAVGAICLAGLFIAFIWRDITRSNRYRKELEEANRRAEDLLEAREKLMLAITHDFKAPLGSIIGYIDLMRQLALDGKQQFYLSNMKSSSSHLLKLVNDLLDFHRLDLNKAEINRVAFDPGELFDEVYASFQPLADAKRLSLHYNISAELRGRFVSDPLRIRQIVANLLSNAVKFTLTGSVTLRVAYKAPDVQITVSDTGKGMAPDDKARIFQEFTRLPGAQGEEGFGLGLSIVAKLVHLLEGEIQVESTEGEGSSFVVTLPLSPAEAGTDTRESLRVLLIDDDKIQLDLTSAMLERRGMSAVCCQQPEELTEHLRRDTFDLLLTDVQMPAINGFDLLTLLRASNIPQARTIPVIAVTARSEMKEADFLRHGFAGYLTKPFTLDDLLAAINKRSAPTDGDTLNLSALTAFSEGDEAGARSIIGSFIAETTGNLETLRSALDAKDVERIAAMAHKLLPLFTLIGATKLTPLLEKLEDRRASAFTDDIRTDTERVIVDIERMVSEFYSFL